MSHLGAYSVEDQIYVSCSVSHMFWFVRQRPHKSGFEKSPRPAKVPAKPQYSRVIPAAPKLLLKL